MRTLSSKQSTRRSANSQTEEASSRRKPGKIEAKSSDSAFLKVTEDQFLENTNLINLSSDLDSVVGIQKNDTPEKSGFSLCESDETVDLSASSLKSDVTEKKSDEVAIESTETAGSANVKAIGLEVQLVVDFLKDACFEVVSSSDIQSKEFLEAVIKAIISALEEQSGSRFGEEEKCKSAELFWSKVRIGIIFLLICFIWISIVFVLRYDDGEDFPGFLKPT